MYNSHLWEDIQNSFINNGWFYKYKKGIFNGTSLSSKTHEHIFLFFFISSFLSFGSMFTCIFSLIQREIKPNWSKEDRKFIKKYAQHKKSSFPLRVFSVNVTKSAENGGFGHIYWRNPSRKTSFFVQGVMWKLFKSWPNTLQKL